MSFDWGSRLEYLKATRKCYMNDDYLEFLINRVWKIERPVNIIDFGCGFGHLGLTLLPLLPPGSTYTGLDISEALLEEARTIFQDSPYKTEFIQADLAEYQPVMKYEIAICRTVLQHIPEGFNIIDKMKASVLPGGKVICMETDRNTDNAGLYFEGLDIDSYNNLGILQKLWHEDFKRGGGDHTIGKKIPAYMQRIGLKNVGVRLSDYIQFINPFSDQEEYEINKRSLLADWNIGEANREAVIKSLIERGLTDREANVQYETELAAREFIKSHIDEAMMLSPLFLFISYGDA